MKKLVALLLSLLVVFGTVGCTTNEGPGGGKIDPNKTQLAVSNYNGGYGEAWLYAAVDRFEKAYATTQFEAGKTGVQIVIHSDKDGYSGTGLRDKMAITTDEVFFSESIGFNDYVSQGFMLDISDIVTGENLDGKTIESKMTAEQQNSLKIGGKYYCVPHYAAYAGINYDIDLFDDKDLYYAKDGAPSEPNYTGTAKYTNLAGQRSKGPDGQYGTDDDGLPATYDEFFALCGMMKSKYKITPFIWTGVYRTTYISWILAALAADYEGKEQMMLNYEFDGVAKNLATIDNGAIKFDAQDTTITNANGYELYRSAGRYYALEFLEQILDNNYVMDSSYGDSSATSAQDTFLRSKQKNAPIAMIMEGIWWENEAAETFTAMADRYGEAWKMENRRFGLMPLPKASADKIGQKATFIDNNESYAFINGNISPEKVELAKLFLKFCYTDQSLQEFTTIVGLPKNLQYDMPSDTQWKSAYSENVWSIYENSDVIIPVSQNPLYLSAQSTFYYYSTFRTTLETSAVDALRGNRMSSEEFFDGIVKYNTQTKWNQNFSKFF